MRHFISAIQFITILPWGGVEKFNPQRMVPYFPIVGIVLGVLVALFDTVAVGLWGKTVASLLDVIFLTVLTGAFHIDGLGDAADGLLGQRPKEKTLAIMKDSRLGTMGLVAIVTGLSIKWAGIAGLDANRPLLLIIVPAYARASMLSLLSARIHLITSRGGRALRIWLKACRRSRPTRELNVFAHAAQNTHSGRWLRNKRAEDNLE